MQGQHASNLGGILAREIGDEIGVPSYIVDPVVVDEMEPVARYSGIPELPRISIFHALNQKAVAKRYAKEQSVSYDSLNLVVVHMGGGVSVGAHKMAKLSMSTTRLTETDLSHRNVPAVYRQAHS